MGRNLCFKFSNGSCRPILIIYVSRYFQWYEEFCNPMSFDLWNHSLNIQDFLKTPIPKMGVHLGMCEFIPSHSFTFWECKCDSQVALSTHTFPCPCFGSEPKTKVVTCLYCIVMIILKLWVLMWKFYKVNKVL